MSPKPPTTSKMSTAPKAPKDPKALKEPKDAKAAPDGLKAPKKREEAFFCSHRPSFRSRAGVQRKAATTKSGKASRVLTDGERKQRAEAKHAALHEKVDRKARIARNLSQEVKPPQGKFFRQLAKEKREAAKIRATELEKENRRVEMKPSIPLERIPAEKRREAEKKMTAERAELLKQNIKNSEKAKNVASTAQEKAERRRLALKRALDKRIEEREAA